MDRIEKPIHSTGWLGQKIETKGWTYANPYEISWKRVWPFVAMHLGCLAVFWVGVSPVALFVAVGLYGIRMFAITGFYHRYFAHRTFQASRSWQFVFAVLGSSAAQRGPIWWASHHRHHHSVSDRKDDLHSPVVHGFWWSHMGWFISNLGFQTRKELVRDWLRYPELRFIDRFDMVAPTLLAALTLGLGYFLENSFPFLGTSGPQMFVWGFVVSTVVLYHCTYTINSLAHRFGSRPYATHDESRNNLWLAILTLGEGWHNNHHFDPTLARQGFRWWEWDPTFYFLWFMGRMGIARNLRVEGRKASE